MNPNYKKVLLAEYKKIVKDLLEKKNANKEDASVTRTNEIRLTNIKRGMTKPTIFSSQ
jgi:hypothetical protein